MLLEASSSTLSLITDSLGNSELLSSGFLGEYLRPATTTHEPKNHAGNMDIRYCWNTHCLKNMLFASKSCACTAMVLQSTQTICS